MVRNLLLVNFALSLSFMNVLETTLYFKGEMPNNSQSKFGPYLFSLLSLTFVDLYATKATNRTPFNIFQGKEMIGLVGWPSQKRRQCGNLVRVYFHKFNKLKCLLISHVVNSLGLVTQHCECTFAFLSMLYRGGIYVKPSMTV